MRSEVCSNFLLLAPQAHCCTHACKCSKTASKAHSKTIASKAPVSTTAHTYSNASKAHLQTTVSKTPVSTTVRTHTNDSKAHLQTNAPMATINKQTTKRLKHVYVK